MLRIFVLILTAALLAPALGFSAERNQLCREANLHYLMIKGVAGFESTDQCYRSDRDLAAPVASVIRQIGALNRRLASVLGISVEQLLTDEYGYVGIGVVIQGNPFGPLGSSSRRYNGIRMGVFPDWPAGLPAGLTEPRINDAVYVHELSHIVADASPALPSIIRELQQTALFPEAFADAMALAVMGEIFTNTDSLPQCFDRLRFVGTIESYDYPAGYFDRYFEPRRMKMCCDHLARKGALDPHTQPLCQELDHAVAREPFPKLDRAKFVPELFARNPRMFDRHQLGIPLNSFLLDLERSIGRSAGEIFVRALARASQGIAPHVYACRIAHEELAASPVEARVRSFEDVFAAMREELPAADQLVFDHLSSKHALSTGMSVASWESKGSALAQAISAFNKRPPHACSGFAGRPDYLEGKCLVSCTGVHAR